jgi:hypothetical protein
MSRLPAQRPGIPWFGVAGKTLLALIAALATTDGVGLAQDKEKSWQGTWNNRRAGTTGPLRCTATPKDDKTWEADFEGMFMTRRFNYTVTLATARRSGRTLLQGTATIDGDEYRWEGYTDGRVLFGRFRSAKGNNGEFRLQESKN